MRKWKCHTCGAVVTKVQWEQDTVEYWGGSRTLPAYPICPNCHETEIEPIKEE